MDNEEKLLELLNDLKSAVSDMKGDMDALRQDVAIVRLDIENRMEPQIQSLAEGQKTLL